MHKEASALHEAVTHRAPSSQDSDADAWRLRARQQAGSSSAPASASREGVGRDSGSQTSASPVSRHRAARDGRLRRWLLNSRLQPYAVAEVIAGMFVTVGVSYVLRPADPLLQQGGFPWIWLIALLFALRYGALLGGLAGLCVIAAWLLFYGESTLAFPTVFFAGGLIQLVVAGHFSDLWGHRGRRLTAENTYLNERLAAVTNRHYLLHESHQRLERDVLARPFTLRDAVDRIRQLSSPPCDEPLPGREVHLPNSNTHPSGSAVRPAEHRVQPPCDATPLRSEPQLPNISALLQLVTCECQLESAAVYAVNQTSSTKTYWSEHEPQLSAGFVNKVQALQSTVAVEGASDVLPRASVKAQHISSVPVASVGQPFELNCHDALLEYCIQTCSLVHVRHLENAQSQYQVCAPLVTGSGRLVGVLVVRSIAFVALNQNNLQLLQVLLTYYADGLDESKAIARAWPYVPTCPRAFLVEVARLSRIRQSLGVESSLVGLAFSDGHQVDLLAHHLQKQGHASDLFWSCKGGTMPVLVALLPLADEADVDAYLQNVNRVLQTCLSSDLARAGINVSVSTVLAHESDFGLRHFLSQCARQNQVQP